MLVHTPCPKTNAPTLRQTSCQLSYWPRLVFSAPQAGVDPNLASSWQIPRPVSLLLTWHNKELICVLTPADYFKAIHWAPDVPRLVHQSLRRELAAIEDELNRLYTRVSLPVPVTTRYTGPCATMFTVLHGNRSSSRHLSSYKKSIIRVHAFVRPWYGLDKELVHAEVAIPGAAEVHYTTITFMGPVPESTVTMDTFVGQGNVFGVSVVASGRLRISNPDPSNSEHVKRFDDALVVQSFQARRDGGTRQPTSFLDVLYTFQLAKTAADVGVDIWMPEEDLPPPPILMAPEVELHGPIPKRAEAVGWLPPWCWRLEADPPPRSATFCHLDCGDSSKERLPVSLDIGDNTTFCDADFFVDCPPFLDFPESARYYDLFTSDVE